MQFTAPFKLRHLAFAAVLVTLWGCDPPIDPDTQRRLDSIALQQRLDSIAMASQTDELRSGVLCDLIQNVVLPIVDRFDAQAGALQYEIQMLSGSRTPENLARARQAWRDTRVPWEMCEAFLFGPAKVQQLDPAVDSWPIDLITIDSMLISKDWFTPEYFDVSEGTVKGAHAIELFLWGKDGQKRVEEITPREFEFIVAASESMQGAAARLKHGWIPLPTMEGRGYAREICDAGLPGSLYTSRAGAVREFLNALVMILTEVSDAKMGIPYSQQSTEFEEARFSGNSMEDFKANLLGVKSIYTGSYGHGSGRGIRDLVRAADSALDARVERAIATAIARVEEIGTNFSEAVINDRNAVQTARYSLTQLATLFDMDVREKILPAR
jgi:putative iron-regulated protein